LGGEQVMTMYHSNAVSPGGAGIRYTGEARALRA